VLSVRKQILYRTLKKDLFPEQCHDVATTGDFNKEYRRWRASRVHAELNGRGLSRPNSAVGEPEMR
jgi:hypothetical protein